MDHFAAAKWITLSPPLKQIIQRAPESYARLCAWIYGTGIPGGLLFWLLPQTATVVPFVGSIAVALGVTALSIFHATLFGRHLQIEGTKSYGVML